MAQIVQKADQWLLSGDVVILTASAILKSSQALSLANHTTIDFAHVADIDTTAISLILEWKRRAAKEMQTIACVNLPVNLASLLDLYGVADLIQ